jgi:hypothetical protein
MKTILDFSDYESAPANHGCQEVVARTPEEHDMLDQYIGAEKRVQQILGQVMARMRRNGLPFDRRFGRSVKLDISATDEPGCYSSPVVWTALEEWALCWMIVDIKGHPMVSGLCTGILMLVPIYGIGFFASLILTGHWKPRATSYTKSWLPWLQSSGLA